MIAREHAIAIIIACLVSFRAFFTRQGGCKRRQQYNAYMAEPSGTGTSLPHFSRARMTTTMTMTMSRDSMTQTNLFDRVEKGSNGTGPSSSSLAGARGGAHEVPVPDPVPFQREYIVLKDLDSVHKIKP